MQFKDKVKYVRKQLHLSQLELAKQLHVDYCTVNKWENGVYKPQPQKEQIFYNFSKQNGIDFNKLSQVTEELKTLNIELSELDTKKQFIENRIKCLINEVISLLDEGEVIPIKE